MAKSKSNDAKNSQSATNDKANFIQRMQLKRYEIEKSIDPLRGIPLSTLKPQVKENLITLKLQRSKLKSLIDRAYRVTGTNIPSEFQDEWNALFPSQPIELRTSATKP